jgi:hypothetical protein
MNHLPDLNYLFQIVVISMMVIFVAGLILAGLAYLAFIFFKYYRGREEKSLDFVLLQVAVPRENEIKIDVAEQMFASLYAIKKGGKLSFLKPQDHFTFEIVALPEDIRFYISCPRKLRDLIEKQINGAYPDAQIKETKEYNIFSEDGKVAFTSLGLRSAAYYPLKVYRELPTDPLSSLTAALAKMGEGEGAAIQIMISPADKKWQSAGRKFISQTKKEEADPEKAKYKTDAKTLEAIENKCSKPGFETTIRIVVCSDTLESAKAHLSNIKSAFEQFSSGFNGLKSQKNRLKVAFMNDFIYRYQPMMRLFSRQSILNSEELASIFHLPNKTVETPHVFWLAAKAAPAPAEIATAGLYIGKSAYRGMERKVYLTDKDRGRHVYIIGKTGTGKTELMKSMILQDLKAGRGLCLIDPHDLAEEILAYIPPERAEEVIYFDPSDTERPMGLNLLEARNEDEMHFVSTAIINLMYKLYDPYKTGIIGPRFEHGIRNAMLTVMVEPGSTFVEVVRAMTDSSFVKALLPKVTDQMVKRYWTDQIAQTADFHKSEVLDYTVSKFGRFVTNKTMRNIIGQSKSAFDFRRVMDEGKILIINLAKGKLGEENSNFLGLVLVPKILVAAMSRTDMPEPQRRDFHLYVDEFQNFATPDFSTILAEARKYHLNLTVANQFIGQVEEEVKNAVFGNVGTLIAFQVGVADASFLQHEFTPTFSESDLLNVERFHAYIKTVVNGQPVTPFSMDTTKDLKAEQAQANEKVAEIVKEMSRLKFGVAREEVEAEIVRRARL